MFLGKDTYFYIGGNFWDKLVKGAVDDVRIYNCFMDADQAKQIAAMEGCKTNIVTIDKGESVTENKITYQIYQDGHAVVTGCSQKHISRYTSGTPKFSINITIRTYTIFLICLFFSIDSY